MPAPPLILLVEDDADVTQIVETLLTFEGYRVLSAPHGAAALDLLETVRPDVILLDMLMPVMDGWHFAAAYRAAPPPHAPIVVLTAAMDVQQRAREIGAEHFVGKPFNVRELLAVVERLTRSAPSQETAGVT